MRTDPTLAACYLETLGVLISYKGKIIKKNQNQIMIALTTDNQNIIITLKEPNYYKHFILSQENLLKNIGGNIKGVAEVSGILDYFN